jgi:hypothetical protein
MHIVAAVLALLLLVIVLSPIILRRFRLARRERAVHRDGGCHWYANYDEDLRYEPHSHADIVRLPREDVLHRGYRPTEDVQIVPRTFRHRVPGDVKIRLWKNGDPDAIALWLCEWAMNPVRIAIGVGERESVPGVESGRVPTHPESPKEAPQALDEERWSLHSAGSAQSADESTAEARTGEARADAATAAASDAMVAEGAPADVATGETSGWSESSSDDARKVESNPPATTERESGEHGRTRRKHRRRR